MRLVRIWLQGGYRKPMQETQVCVQCNADDDTYGPGTYGITYGPGTYGITYGPGTYGITYGPGRSFGYARGGISRSFGYARGGITYGTTMQCS